MDRSLLTPGQLRVVDDLMALGAPRPSFARELAPQLRDAIEGEVADLVDGLEPSGVWVDKAKLAQVHACERHFQGEQEGGFPGWDATTAKGTVVHRALELSVGVKGDVTPFELVDHAIETLRGEDRRGSPGPWLLEATPLELAELRAQANDAVAKFQECWPPLSPAWAPRTETGIGADLCLGRVVLWGRVDLVLGRARGQEARALVVDLKTGRPHAAHVDDLRFYALVQALRVGVPPFRVASYYLDTATFHVEDVTEEVLESAARRVAAGVRKMVELRDRDAAVTEGPRCTWCRLRASCDGAVRWAARREELDL